MKPTTEKQEEAKQLIRDLFGCLSEYVSLGIAETEFDYWLVVYLVFVNKKHHEPKAKRITEQTGVKVRLQKMGRPKLL